MSKKNLLTGRDKELQELADRYEGAKQEGKSIYMDAEEFADLADWYAIHHKYETADEVVEYGLGIHPGNTSLLMVKANMCLELNQVREAKKIVSKIEEETDEVVVLKADILYMEGHPRKAQAMLDKLEDKDDLRNIVDVAYLYLDNGDPLKAEEWLKRGKGFYDNDEAYLGALGDCYHALELPDKAIECFNKLIDLVPYSATFWYGLARCYYAKEMPDKLIEACDYATDIDEEYGDAHMLKATGYALLGNEEKAVESYLLAEKYNVIPHSFVDAYRGVSCANKGEWQKGIDYMERALKAKDNEECFYKFPTEELYYHYALCLYGAGKYTKAHQYCRKAQELLPYELSSYLLNGSIYMKEGKEKKAREQWETAFDISPYAETLYDIAMQCMDADNYTVAREYLEEVKKMDPDYEDINECLATLSILLEDFASFTKYNKQCRKPMKPQEIKKLLEMFRKIAAEGSLLEAMKELYRIQQLKP